MTDKSGMDTARVFERLFERVDALCEVTGKTNAEIAKLSVKLTEQTSDTKRLVDAVEGSAKDGGLKHRVTVIETHWKAVAWALAPLYAAAIGFLVNHFSK